MQRMTAQKNTYKKFTRINAIHPLVFHRLHLVYSMYHSTRFLSIA